MRRVRCAACGVKNEKLAFLSENTKYTLRFAMQIGGLCRAMTIDDVARLMRLHWHTVKDLSKLYMREQLRLAGHPKPRVIGIDEVSVKKGHSYRIVVSDLEARRAIWFGGEGRTEADMDLFFAFLGKKNNKLIRVAVMDMWPPFRKSTLRHAPRYVLLSRRENLSDDGRKNLERLLVANARLNVAYLLREQFEQLWDYASADGMRAFFDAWRNQLRGQDLGAYEKFAAMVEKHWDGVVAHSQPTHNIPLGFVEGFNNKIRVIQRRAYGLRDEEYLKLKILTAGLPKL